MSAFMCSDRHLSLLARAAVQWGLDKNYHLGRDMVREREEATFQLLGAENFKSLEARYPASPGEGPGSMTDEPRVESTPVIHIIKACHCYAYQACEHRGWEESEARRMVDAIVGHAVRLLPGYETAPWGI